MTYIVQHQESYGQWYTGDNCIFDIKEKALYRLIELDSDEREPKCSRRIIFHGKIKNIVVIAYGRHHQPELKKEKSFYMTCLINHEGNCVIQTEMHDKLEYAEQTARSIVHKGQCVFVMKSLSKVSCLVEEYKE